MEKIWEALRDGAPFSFINLAVLALVLAIIAERAVWLKLGLDRPVVMGCSMGGAIVLKVAAEYQEELTGIVGLESSAYAPGR